jgi:plastocyanin
MVRISGHPVKRVAPLLLLGITFSACGGDDNGGTPPPTTAITKDISGSGDGQIGTVGQPLPEPIRVLVSEDGLPAPGLTVTWSTTAAGAELAASSVSDAAGIASNNWTLGTVPGPQSAQAALTGADGSPVTFNATAGAGPEQPSDATVTVNNNNFSPTSLTVAAGTTVTWQWAPSAVNHDVTPAASLPPGSGPPSNAPDSYQFTFNTPGTYTYYCTQHGTPTGGMRGTITVQ